MKKISILALSAIIVFCSCSTEKVRYDTYELIDMKTKQSVTILVPYDTEPFYIPNTACKYTGEMYLR